MLSTRKPCVGSCVSNVLVEVVNWSLSDQKSRKVRTSGKAGENRLVGHPNSTFSEILHLGYPLLHLREPYACVGVGILLDKAVS